MSESDPLQPLTALVEQWRYQSTLSNGTLKQGDGWRVMQICADELDDLLPALREQWVQLTKDNQELLSRLDRVPKAEHGDLRDTTATGDAPTPLALARLRNLEDRLRCDSEEWADELFVCLTVLAADWQWMEARMQKYESCSADGDAQQSALSVAAPDKPGRDSAPGIGAQVLHDGWDDSRGLSSAHQAGDAATLRGYINTFKETPSMTASNRDHWKARAVAAEALVADLQQQIHALSAWRDMASAPIDGTIVQVTDTKRVSAGRFIPRGDVGPLGHWYTFDDVRPTGWLPLPALPSTPQENKP